MSNGIVNMPNACCAILFYEAAQSFVSSNCLHLLLKDQVDVFSVNTI
jgi:hypothetical protein